MAATASRYSDFKRSGNIVTPIQIAYEGPVDKKGMKIAPERGGANLTLVVQDRFAVSLIDFINSQKENS